jgi:hypothetical protein
LRGFAKTFFKAGQDGIERPMQGSTVADRTVWNAMDNLEGGFAICPAEQGDTAAFSA